MEDRAGLDRPLRKQKHPGAAGWRWMFWDMPAPLEFVKKRNCVLHKPDNGYIEKILSWVICLIGGWEDTRRSCR